MTVSEAELRKHGAINGIYAGIIILVINIIVYYFITASTLPFWLITVGLNALIFILYVVTVSVFISRLRARVGGYWSFKQAATGIFFLVVVAYAINYIGRDLIFARLIETDMAGKTKQAIINADVQRMQQAHFSQDSIQKSLAVLDKKISATETVTTFQQAAGLPILLIMLFVVSIIFAAIFKRDPPVYRKAETDAIG